VCRDEIGPVSISAGVLQAFPGIQMHRIGGILFSQNKLHPIVIDAQAVGYHGEHDIASTDLVWLLYVGYGLTEDMVIALETALYVRETQWKSSEDTSTMPDQFEESGFGDTGLHIHWRLMREAVRRPAFFTYLEVGLPLQKDKDMIGTDDWEFVPGVGILKGFSWGTVTGKISLDYSAEDEELALGECAVEYLKRLSPSWRVYLGVAGDGDEIELIPELQWHVNESMFVKFNSALGLTPEAADWAPEVGVMFSFQ
jgi:hypothetical protein